MSIVFHLLWVFVLSAGLALQQDDVCQNLVIRTEPVEEIQLCSSPVITYLTETADGWQIAVWNNTASSHSDEPLIDVVVADGDPAPDSPVLLGSYSRRGLHVLLLQLDSGAYEVLAGPDARGQMYDLIFTLPPDGQETRQDFTIAE